VDGGAGQYQGRRTTLQDVRRQGDVRGAVWPLGEQPDDPLPPMHWQLVHRPMHDSPWYEQGCQFVRIPEHGRVLEHGLELLR
jgi:hypothetical protein